MKAVSLSFASALSAALVACVDSASAPLAFATLHPIVDSLYVGEEIPAPIVTYFDGRGGSEIVQPSQVGWQSTNATVLSVAADGTMKGLKRGIALIIATLRGTQGNALIAVSDSVDVTLLVDTLYLLPGDTMTIPTIILDQNPPAPTVSYAAPPSNGVFAVDTNTGLVTALAAGGPVKYIVSANAAKDSGAVHVLHPTDVTTAGKAFFSVRGSANGHVSGPASAVHYPRANGRLGFRLEATFLEPGGSQVRQLVQVTLPDSVLDAVAFDIDSISPAQATARPPQDATCEPPVRWALWALPTFRIVAYSVNGGEISVTRVVPITGGQAISGRFEFRARREDLYTNPHGSVTITGSFVAPLVTDQTLCTL